MLTRALLNRYERSEGEGDIRQAVRGFIVGTGLPEAGGIAPEADGSSSRQPAPGATGGETAEEAVTALFAAAA